MRLLAAYDGSEDSAEALAKTVELAGETGAELIVLRILNPLTDALDVHALSASEGLRKVVAREEAHARELMGTLGDPPATLLVEVFGHGEDVAGHIAKVAQERAADIVVVASKRASGVRGLLLGSVAQHVLRLSPCPVLVVRPGM
jgi:nucleotide-binding universal stress UspA family protein